LTVYSLDPLRDPRWEALVRGHPAGSVFHSPAWLEALRRTYGYEPVAFTTSPPGTPLACGMVFCRVESWLTGRRLVSLPFSDHCAPLAGSPEDLAALGAFLRAELPRQGWKYLEVRPRHAGHEGLDGFVRSQPFYLHTLDLRPPLDRLFRSFHRDSVQRRIRHAEREGLTCESGRSEALLRTLHRLVAATRRRHRLPPQPLAWFRNLAASLGEALTVRVVSKDGRPVAAMLTLHFGSTAVYKYGGSDAALHRLGGMPLLTWRAIEDARARGAVVLDLGRSDLDDHGLVTFKERWGAARSRVCYLRWPGGAPERTGAGWAWRLGGRVVSRLPAPLLRMTGEILYRHMG
jgi:hypothetical protein